MSSSNLNAAMKAANEELDNGGDVIPFASFDGSKERSKPTPLICARPFEATNLRPRKWVYGRSHLRNYLSLVLAPGGVGKSRLMVIEALAMATGKALTGHWVKPDLKVWLWNLEDEADEINNCIISAANHYNIQPADYAGRLYVNDGSDSLCIAKQEGGATVVCVASEQALIDEIKRREIDVLTLDPFVSTHGLPENDNNAIQQAADAWKRVARATNCAITLVHHTSKRNGASTSAESARGASSLVNAARIVRVLDRMPESMATELSLDGSRFFSVGSDKPNLNPNGRGCDWYECISCPLPAEDSDSPLDSVGVATVWTPPDDFTDITLDMCIQAWNLIAQTPIARASNQSPDWIGHAIAKLWGWGKLDNAAMRKMTRIIKGWEGNAIRKVSHKDTAKGKSQPVYTRIPHHESEVGEQVGEVGEMHASTYPHHHPLYRGVGGGGGNQATTIEVGDLA